MKVIFNTRRDVSSKKTPRMLNQRRRKNEDGMEIVKGPTTDKVGAMSVKN